MSNEFNDIIKQHVDRHESEVDPKEIWEGILNKQKPKRRLFYFFLPISLVAVIGLSFSLWNSSETEQLYSELEINQEEISTDRKDNAVEKEVAITNSVTESIDLSDSNNGNIRDRKLNTNRLSHSQNPIKKVETALTQVDNFAIVNKEISTPIGQALINTSQFLMQSEGEERSLKTRSNKTSKNLKDQISSTASLFNLSTAQQKNVFKPIALLPITSHSILETREISLNAQVAFSKQISPLPHSSKSYIKAMLLAGSLSSTSTSYNGEAYTARLLYEHSIFRDFSFSTGLSFDRLYEKFQWNGQYITDSNGENVGLASLDDQGNAAVNFGSVDYDEEYYEIIEREIDTYNQYDLVSIPLMVGYNLRLARWRATLSLGTSIHIDTRIAGLGLDSNMVPQELSSDDFKAGSNCMLGLEFSYPFSKSIALYSSLNYSRRAFTYNAINNSANIFQAGLGLNISLSK